MPRPGPNSTYHKKLKPWEFFQYPFTPNVIIAERKTDWYDIERFRYIKYLLNKEGVQFFWNEPTDEEKHRKHSGVIELYKKFPKNVSFQDKMRDIQNIIKRYGL